MSFVLKVTKVVSSEEGNKDRSLVIFYLFGVSHVRRRMKGNI